MSIKYRSPLQLTQVAAQLAALKYDANTRTSQAADGTVIISNRKGVIEVLTNGEHRFRG